MFEKTLKWLTRKNPPGPNFLDVFQDAPIRREYFCLNYPQTLIKKYGDIIRMPFLQRSYLIAEPEAFEYVLKDNAPNFVKSNSTYLRMRLLFGNSTLTNEGEAWRSQRPIIMPAFQRSHFPFYANIVKNETLEFIEGWKAIPSSRLDIPEAMDALMLSVAFKIFGNLALPSPLIKPFTNSFEYLNDKMCTAFILSLFFYKNLIKINTILKSLIENRQKINPDFPDALTLLQQASDEKNILFSPQDVLDEFKTLILTGYETTAGALSWTWYLLAKNPTYRTRMQTEIRTVLGNKSPDFDDLAKLPLTKAIFQETLRLYPQAWSINRLCVEDDVVCGYDIPKGSLIMLNAYCLHRNPRLWESPEQFKPERFLDNKDPSKRFTYVPFSIGPHACIASQLALMQAMIILVTITQHLNFELVSPRFKPKALPLITLRPYKIPVKIVLP